MNAKRTAYLRAVAGTAAALLTALSMSTVCRAENEDASSVSPEDLLITSGDYQYSVMTGLDDENKKAAQIEYYHGSETDLTIPTELDGLPVVSLGEYAYASAQTLQTVTIPETIIGLGTYAFANCQSITEFRVAENNEFCMAKNGILYSKDEIKLIRYPIGNKPETVTVEDGIEVIGNSAFTGCRTLKEVKLPDTVTELGNSAFADCYELTAINLPNGITEIPNFAFNSCKSLKEIKLPTQLVIIGNAAFSNTALETIYIPETVTTIGMQAFTQTKLTSVTIPPACTDIGYSAFGWKADSTGELIMDKDFVIRGYAGSAAEDYATDPDDGNNFKFITLSESQQKSSDSSADDSSENPGDSAAEDSGSSAAENSAADSAATATTAANSEESGLSTGRIIGIVCCGVLLIAIAVIAVVSGKKGKKQE